MLKYIILTINFKYDGNWCKRELKFNNFLELEEFINNDDKYIYSIRVVRNEK